MITSLTYHVGQMASDAKQADKIKVRACKGAVCTKCVWCLYRQIQYINKRSPSKTPGGLGLMATDEKVMIIVYPDDATYQAALKDNAALYAKLDVLNQALEAAKS